MIKVGIDIGSRTTKAVLLNKDNIILAKHILPSKWEPEKAGKKVFEAVIKKAGIERTKISKITATGYGRILLSFADKVYTEITCHAKGAYFLNHNVRTVIDIGGQDSKVIRIDKFGFVEDFAMNDRCAAGTGKFLEFLAHSLGVKISDFGKLALESKSPADISSMCTVFAESEVLSLVAENVSKADIIAGIHYSIARRIEGLINLTGFNKIVVLTGGVAKNLGIRQSLEQLLNVPLMIPQNPEFIGALGAAIIS